MDSETYKRLSAKTLSRQFHTEIVHANEVDKLFQAIASVGEWADSVKKALFYGKSYNPRTAIMGSSLSLDPQYIDYLHGVLGSFTESVELCEHLHKVLCKQQEFDRTNCIEEEGDLAWYSALRWRFLEISPEQDIYEPNINKLKKRYANKFSEDEALNRDLEQERKVLENSLKSSELTSINKDEFVRELRLVDTNVDLSNKEIASYDLAYLFNRIIIEYGLNKHIISVVDIDGEVINMSLLGKTPEGLGFLQSLSDTQLVDGVQ